MGMTFFHYCHWTIFFCNIHSDVLYVTVLPCTNQPEGIEKEVTQSSLICTKGKNISPNSVLDWDQSSFPAY